MVSPPCFFRFLFCPSSGQPSIPVVCFWSNNAVADFDGAVEMRLVQVFFWEMEVLSAPSTPAPVSATGKLFQICRRRLLSPGGGERSPVVKWRLQAKLSLRCVLSTVDEISLRMLSLIIATQDFKVLAVRMFGAGELWFDSGEPKCGSPVVASSGGGATACETRVPRCGGVNPCPVLSSRLDLCGGCTMGT
ncbi:hypothetical protein Rs2_10683 [Raphanus sativus]|nr:hypothetical protein Rs2_10683 [Raphanus sativus]